MNSFSKNLKSIRNSKGLTQIKVAQGADISERVYIRYESGGAFPSFHKLIALADFFNVSLDYLVGRTDNPKRL